MVGIEQDYKKKKQRSDGGKTRDRQRTDEGKDERQTKNRRRESKEKAEKLINKAALSAALFYGDP